jgi:predicted AAA+ superfamily ATPase
MYQRFAKYTKSKSFFLFGPRGSGKSTWLKQTFGSQNCLWFNLLTSETELQLARDPDLILKKWVALKRKPDYIIIDEIQKIPKLLDVVHQGIEEHKIKFILTGSSARKIKRGSANMLAGRAFEFFMLPFSVFELEEDFVLDIALNYGMLPEIYSQELKDSEDKERYLFSYISTYLKEEIAAEQIVRNLDPFRKFLDVAAQMNGQIINYSKIGRDAGIDPKQVERYFPILIDTLIGFNLEPHHQSIRKRQNSKAKFYFFDVGVCRALQNSLSANLVNKTTEYGNAFEHFFILEIIKMNLSLEKRWKLSYLRVNDNQEIDLIVETKTKTFLIEIKSSIKVDPDEVQKMTYFKDSFPKAQFLFLSQDKNEFKDNGILCQHWLTGLEMLKGL